MFLCMWIACGSYVDHMSIVCVSFFPCDNYYDVCTVYACRLHVNWLWTVCGMWNVCELTINHMNHDTGAACRRRLARVVASVRCLSIRYAQPAEGEEMEEEKEN